MSHRVGVSVPGIRFVDLVEGVLGIEWIDGQSVRALLGGDPEPEDEDVLAEGYESPSGVVDQHTLETYNITDGQLYDSRTRS
jgi:TP53 regulating kinase and related kinases